MALKNGLLKQAKEEKKNIQQQIYMHEKYHIQDENKIIVEKNNMFKFFIKSLASVIRIACWIILIMLAAIGLMALIHPDMRAILVQNMYSIFSEIRNLV